MGNTTGTQGPDQATQQQIAQMQQNAANMQAVTMASNDIQTKIGIAQVYAQTTQTGVSAAKAASRPA